MKSVRFCLVIFSITYFYRKKRNWNSQMRWKTRYRWTIYVEAVADPNGSPTGQILFNFIGFFRKFKINRVGSSYEKSWIRPWEVCNWQTTKQSNNMEVEMDLLHHSLHYFFRLHSKHWLSWIHHVLFTWGTRGILNPMGAWASSLSKPIPFKACFQGLSGCCRLRILRMICVKCSKPSSKGFDRVFCKLTSCEIKLLLSKNNRSPFLQVFVNN